MAEAAVARDRVVRNSAYLVASTALTAGLGFLFWVVAARLFSPAEIGQATSLTNAMSIIAYVSLCGLNSTLVRFPAAAERRNAQITQSILVVGCLACVVGSGYVAGLRFYGQRLVFVQHHPAMVVAVVLFCAVCAVNLLTDAVFISARLTQYNTVADGLVQGVTKLLLPFVLVGTGAFGPVVATGGGYAAAVLASVVLMRRRLGFRFEFGLHGTRLREQFGFSAASYVSSLLNIGPLLVIPLIVLQRLGAADAGYYFVAFQVANLANAASYAVSEAMFAEVSADEGRYGEVVRRAGGLIALVQVPAATALVLVGGPVLRVFGASYAAHGRSLLVVLAVGTLAVAVNTWASFAVKLARLMGPLIWSNVVFAAATVGLSAAWAPRGLVWFGWAWCVGNLASALVALTALVVSGPSLATPRQPSLATPGQPSPATPRQPRQRKERVMRVVVVNAYVRENAGDAALLTICLRQLSQAFPDASVLVAGMEEPARHPDFHGVPNVGSVRAHVVDGNVSRARRILRTLAGMAVGSLCVAVPPRGLRLLLPLLPAAARGEIRAVGQADLVVSTGGGYFQGLTGLSGYAHLFFVTLPLLIAQRRGVPVVFAPSSFGPFRSSSQRRLAARVVGRSKLALTREGISVDVLAQCGVRAGHVRRSVDSGFAFDPPRSVDWRARLGVSSTTPLVGVTARRCLSGHSEELYERSMAATMDSIQATGARTVLIPQVTALRFGDDDRLVERRINSYCRRPSLWLEDTMEAEALRDLYSACDLVIGTRFHSVIFSLTAGVPCIAIEYEHKTRGIMRDLGLEEWVIPVGEVTHGRLWALAEKLRLEREGYARVLAERLPAYTARAEEVPLLLRQAIPTAPVS